MISWVSDQGLETEYRIYSIKRRPRFNFAPKQSKRRLFEESN